jgi:hypothetical protein
MMVEAFPGGDTIVILSAKQGDEESGREPEPETEMVTSGSGATLFNTEKGAENVIESSIDGGVGGWTCVFGGWFALFATFGWLNS